MEIYEIVKDEIFGSSEFGCFSRSSVITATMDKDMAEQMLAIYKHNCGEYERYNIRIIQGE